MKLAKILALIGVIAMTIALLNGFINGDFFEDGSVLLNNPWGVVSLVDLYVGFMLFSIWIFIREPSWMAKIIWIVLMMVFGFLTGSVYVFLKLMQSADLKTFFLGNHTNEDTR